ncbi:MAG: ATP-binding protein, partial [Candidatus Wallbacteria bacterium]|nr:ATP-binding protein [Candidatus Wallbacteria bacterium]
KPAIYYQADSVADKEQLKNLGAQVAAFFNEPLLRRGFADWNQFFEYMRRKDDGKIILVIDEYPYLVNANKSISTVFQKGIDGQFKDSGLFLILMGSSIGMMEREVLFQKAPLYGRRTGSLEIREMKFSALKEFFPHKSPAELVAVFGTVGAFRPTWRNSIPHWMSFGISWNSY